MTPYSGGKKNTKQSIETDSAWIQMLELVVKDFKNYINLVEGNTGDYFCDLIAELMNK